MTPAGGGGSGSELPRAELPRAEVVAAVRSEAHPLDGGDSDYDPLMRLVGDAAFVLLGEASHGTREFYRERARITRRLILEKGFCAVAVEADWPDAHLVNRYVRDMGGPAGSMEALAPFRRFPSWMWRNAEVLEFIDWLRRHNQGLAPGAPRVGFYGLDLYSLRRSIEAVLKYLDRVDPDEASRARRRYSVLAHFDRDLIASVETGFQVKGVFEEEVLDQHRELLRRAARYARPGDRLAAHELFNAEQNARLVTHSERFFRTSVHDPRSSWNLRDRHMVDTLERLAAHLGRQGRPARLVVWEHNAHLGDARATEMAQQGELSVGQLMRERHGGKAVLVGASTYRGTVTAASAYGEPPEVMPVPPALPESYEALFHEVGLPGFLLVLRGAAAEGLRLWRPERTIGGIYVPRTEGRSHYMLAGIPDQFDAVLHLDETSALDPLGK